MSSCSGNSDCTASLLRNTQFFILDWHLSFTAGRGRLWPPMVFGSLPMVKMVRGFANKFTACL
eukprot:6668328-Alexandrium_andersonii.AAC.1